MNFIRSSFIVSGMTFISRIFGLIRDIIIAKFFGVSAILDAFLVAFKIPNFLRRLFAEGSFSQAVMPILAKSKIDGNEQEIINHVLGRLFLILFILTLIVVVLSPVVVFLFAPTFYFDDIQKFELTTNLLKLTFPYLLFISLTAFFGSILNNNNNFTIPAITPTLLNISLIVATIYLSPYLSQPIYALAIGVFIGGLLQLLLQLPFLFRINKLDKPTFKNHAVFKDIKNRMMPALFATSITQINLLIDMIVATSLTVGSISWLYYANRLLELPIALIGVAIGIVGIASLSKLFAANKIEQFKDSLNKSINFAMLFAIPATIGLIMLAEPLIITLFNYGNFDIIDGKNSSTVLIIYGFALIFFIINKVITPAFLASGDTKTPVKIAFFAMIVNIIFNIILAYFFSFYGVAAATVIATIVNTIGLWYYLIKKNFYRFNKNNILFIAKIMLSSIPLFTVLLFFDFDYIKLTLWQRILYLNLEVISGIIIYFVSLFVLKIRLKYV